MLPAETQIKKLKKQELILGKTNANNEIHKSILKKNINIKQHAKQSLWLTIWTLRKTYFKSSKKLQKKHNIRSYCHSGDYEIV